MPGCRGVGCVFRSLDSGRRLLCVHTSDQDEFGLYGTIDPVSTLVSTVVAVD